MALNTYSGLQASIANFLARSDLGRDYRFYSVS